MSKAKQAMIRIQQVKSTIGCTEKQKAVLRGLGLRRISAVVERVFEDLQRLNARLPAGRAIPVPRRDALYRASLGGPYGPLAVQGTAQGVNHPAY